MPIQHHLTAAALLTGSAFVLTACAGRAPEPQAASAIPQATVAKTFTLSPVKPHQKRADPGCRLARVDLPADRKAALFRLFDAEHAGADPVLPAPRPDPCRQAAR